MKNILLVSYIFSLFSFMNSNIIIIPFKIMNKNSIDSITKSSDDPYNFIKNEIDKILYTEIYIGDPPKKIIAIITYNSEDLEMHHQTTKNIFSDTLYERNKSKTYKKIEIKDNNDNTHILKQYLMEQIQLYNDMNFKNLITIKELNFSLFETKNENDERSLCFNIGFKLSENDNNKLDINTNIIMQLKKKKLISTYNFNLHYNKINIEGSLYDGYIIIGNEPHQYLKNSYNELQLYKTKACRKDKMLSWDIYFNKIYFKYNEKEYILDNGVDYFNQASLTPNWSVIEGTVTYERNIKNTFFSKLIKDKKCNRIYKDYHIFYYCYKNKISDEELQSFPSLFFSNLELNYIFELNYKDLFLENGNIIYFLVIFYDYPSEIQNYYDEYVSRWDLGIPFLKKYFFTFDYDNKYIGFYNNNTIIQDKKPMIINKNKNTKNKNYFWIIFVILLLICFFILFIKIKYFNKNNKISAIELETDNNLKYSKYHNVEMGQKNLLV